jgi:DNA-binding GntR family transcriptional regulator
VDRTPERPGERVEADLRRRIAAAEWQADEMMPTVAEFAGHYGVSPGVITRVLSRLADDGLVRTVPRWGTFKTWADIGCMTAARARPPGLGGPSAR